MNTIALGCVHGYLLLWAYALNLQIYE